MRSTGLWVSLVHVLSLECVGAVLGGGSEGVFSVNRYSACDLTGQAR